MAYNFKITLITDDNKEIPIGGVCWGLSEDNKRIEFKKSFIEGDTFDSNNNIWDGVIIEGLDEDETERIRELLFWIPGLSEANEESQIVEATIKCNKGKIKIEQIEVEEGDK